MKRGVTIIEIIIILFIAATLAAIALPRAAGFIDSIEVRGAVTEIDALFSTARHLAISRGTQSTLEIDQSRGIISVRAGADTVATRELAAAHGVSLQATRAAITYSPTGVGYGAGNMTLIVARARFSDTILVSRLGRVRH
jgi:Tfp pilus assembly protein FimT